MEPDDPFFSNESDDRTMVRPVPGGRSSDLRKAVSSPTPTPGSKCSLQGERLKLGSLNPIEKSASALLALLTRLTQFQSPPDVALLKTELTSEINSFQDHSQRSGIDQETVYSARYILCTVLDEAVLNTPWGSNSEWSQKSLLSQFHQEVSGGERFFQLLKSLGQNPAKNLHLLELMYLCLSLGFEGRFRVIEGGRDKLKNIQEWLYQVIRKERPSPSHSLSPHWVGITDKRHPLIRFVPLWVLAMLTFLLLALIYSSFWFSLTDSSSPVVRQLSELQSKVNDLEFIRTESILVQERSLESEFEILKKFLVQEISLQQVKLAKVDNVITVIMKGDGLFPSGSARIRPSKYAIIATIGDALEQTEGKIKVVGHTDAVPIRTLKFPSNLDLSLARASSVSALLVKNLSNHFRVMTQGKADWEPVGDNGTASGRRKNRRVEIILRK